MGHTAIHRSRIRGSAIHLNRCDPLQSGMTGLISIAVLVAGAWSAVFVLRGSLALGCTLFLFITACLGLRTFNPGFGPLELGHAALAVLIVAYFVQQQRGLTGNLPLGAADWALLAF